MTEQAAWFTRAGALVLALVAAVTLFSAAPEHHAPGSPEAVARDTCMANAALAGFTAANALGMAEGDRRRREREAECPPPARRAWEPATTQRGLIIGGAALALLVASLVLASMAKREALAEQTLRELQRRRHD